VVHLLVKRITNVLFFYEVASSRPISGKTAGKIDDFFLPYFFLMKLFSIFEKQLFANFEIAVTFAPSLEPVISSVSEL
jgi:hypothetical protein